MFDAIRIRYQPIIELASMKLDSVEMLARGIGADGAVVGPESIVEAMIGCEASMALTGTILNLALEEYVAFGLARLGVSFGLNLPLDALLHPDLVVIVEAIRGGRAGVFANAIHFELTETHPVHDIGRLAAVLTVLREAGYGVALDDVTPETTNLDALLKLPIRAVKLDRSVTTSTAPAQLEFIGRIAARARPAGQAVIAEGIETPLVLERMRRLGVTHGQGFYFAKPLTAQALQAFLGQWTARKTA